MHPARRYTGGCCRYDPAKHPPEMISSLGVTASKMSTPSRTRCLPGITRTLGVGRVWIARMEDTVDRSMFCTSEKSRNSFSCHQGPIRCPVQTFNVTLSHHWTFDDNPAAQIIFWYRCFACATCKQTTMALLFFVCYSWCWCGLGARNNWLHTELCLVSDRPDDWDGPQMSEDHWKALVRVEASWVTGPWLPTGKKRMKWHEVGNRIADMVVAVYVSKKGAAAVIQSVNQQSVITNLGKGWWQRMERADVAGTTHDEFMRVCKAARCAGHRGFDPNYVDVGLFADSMTYSAM